MIQGGAHPVRIERQHEVVAVPAGAGDVLPLQCEGAVTMIVAGCWLPEHVDDLIQWSADRI